MRGKVVYNKNLGDCFIQIDKNNQVCDIRTFDKTKLYAERIGSRVHNDVLNTFRGRPLRLNFLAIVNEITGKEA